MRRLIALGRRRPALIGFIGVVAIALVLGVALNASKLPMFSGTEYRAVFTDASGLQVGEEVRVAGVKVGQVRAIDLDVDEVVVTFDVDGPQLGELTSASIEVKTLLGSHFLSVTPAGSGALGEDDVIPVERTTTPLNVVPAFQRLTTDVQEIDTRQLTEALDSVSGVLEAAAPEVRATLDGLGRLSTSISSRDQQIRQLFRDADAVTGTLAARNDDLAALLGSTEQVLATLDSRRRVIARIITETSALARELSGLVADNERTIGPALAKLNRVLDVLRRNRDNIDESIQNVALYGREFTSVGGTGRFFDGAITFPSGFAVCTIDPPNALNDILDPILSQLNQAINGSTAPCLPLGPAGGEDTP